MSDQVDELQSDNMYEDMARIAEHCGKRIPGGRQTVGLHFCHPRWGHTFVT